MNSIFSFPLPIPLFDFIVCAWLNFKTYDGQWLNHSVLFYDGRDLTLQFHCASSYGQKNIKLVVCAGNVELKKLRQLAFVVLDYY